MLLPNPFDLDNQSSYKHWREKKLKSAPTEARALIVHTVNRASLSSAEIRQIKELCRDTNMAVYDGLTGLQMNDMLALAASFGLQHPDREVSDDQSGISALRVIKAVKGSNNKGAYIPYTDLPLGWHSDGYYNEMQKAVSAIVLHCAQDAAEGGDSQFLDHEIAYIRLRDENPDFIAAMMQSDAMTIPANEIDLERRDEARGGPVFSVISENLHMRYTARSKGILWKEDPVLDQARKFLTDLLNSDDEFILKHHLRPGQGVVCNNVLHKRSGFEDSDYPDSRRLLYRARFFDRI